MAMAKIDTNKWQEFEIGKLFEISRPATRSQAKYSDGDIPFVASGNFSNGVVKYCEPKQGEELDEKNCITVSPLDGSAFYQPNNFLGRGGAGSAILILRNNHLNENNGLFVATAIRASLTKYTYSDQLNSQTIASENIKLPVDSHGCPDWAYMDSFMANVMKESEACLENLRLADKKKTAVNISQWKEFQIGELFDIVKGTRLTKANMREGNNRFIGASAVNNGVTTWIANDEKLHPANTITVCYNGSVGEAFYQDEPFWASDDVNVLYPKFHMTRNMGLFIVPLIRSVGRRYAFVDKWRLDVMKKNHIKLPVDSQENPDWAYMDSFMTEIMKESEICLENLRIVLKI